jgi:SAM-dependent methyltransferase
VLCLLRRHHGPAATHGLLDFGCGTGGFIEYVTSTGFVGRDRALGVDGDEGAIRTLSSRGLLGLHSTAESLHGLRLPFAPDVLTMLDVLEHVDDPSGVLAGLADKATRPATVVVLVPAMQSLWSEWDVRLTHRRRYDRRMLASHLQHGGWEPVSMQYLFPSMVIPAILRQRLGASAGSNEFPEVDLRIDRVLGWCTGLESRLQWWPFGTSLAAVARRK